LAGFCLRGIGTLLHDRREGGLQLVVGNLADVRRPLGLLLDVGHQPEDAVHEPLAHELRHGRVNEHLGEELREH
jgi:hypothetical protein